MNNKYIKLSKTMAHALRHAPQSYGLSLDKEGWTNVEELIEGLRRHSKTFRDVTIHDLQKVIDQSNKKRFEIRDGKIRATYGHSVPTKIEKIPTTPPTILYHGTTSKAAEHISKTGLKPMGRQYVHLSIDIKSANEVGLRRTKEPTILKILARKANSAGVDFYREKNGIWLSDPIPAEFIVKL